MNDILEFLLQFAFWYIIFKIVFAIAERFLTTHTPEEREKLVSKIVSMIHQVKQEQHGDTYCWFDADSGYFLGQGKTDTEIKEHLKQRFKGHIFLIDEDRALAGPDLTVMPIKELTINP